MTYLRQQMTEHMVLKGFAETTKISYLHQVNLLAKYFNRSPEQLSEDDIRQYLLHCHQDKHWSFSSCRQFIHAANFLFAQVLHRPLTKTKLPFPQREQKIPELLSRGEVQRIISLCKNDKYQTAFKVAYGTGMRVSELASLRVRDLDGERNAIRIEGGKGRKDRFVDFTQGLKQCLRTYWREYHPRDWVFYGSNPKYPLSHSCFQKTYARVKREAEIQKRGGIHALRHAYASHQLEAGMPLPQLQKLLGHSHISSTLRYTHWLQYTSGKSSSSFDLLNPM